MSSCLLHNIEGLNVEESMKGDQMAERESQAWGKRQTQIAGELAE